MTTIKWRLDVSGDWANVVNWTPGRLPNSADDVGINTSATHTVTHSTGADTVHTLGVGTGVFAVTGGSLSITSTSSFANRLTVSGGTLALGGAAAAANFTQSGGTVAGAGTLTVGGAATFTSNLLQTGAGATVLQGASTFSGGDFGLDGGRILENQGAFTLTGSGVVLLGANPFGADLGGGKLKNDAGGTIDIQGTNQILASAGVTSFTNAGTLRKTVGTGTADIVATLTNTGKVQVESGNLVVGGAFTNSGSGTTSLSAGAGLFLTGGGSSNAPAFTVAGGATLAFAGGTFLLGAGTVGGAGVVEVTAGTLALAARTTVGVFAQSGGTVSGPGTLAVTGPAGFTSTVLETGAGVTLLKGASTLSGSAGDLNLDGGRILENEGTVTVTGGMIHLGRNPFGLTLGGGTIQNDAGGIVDIQAATTLFDNNLDGAFDNAGTLEQTVTTGVTLIEPRFTNTGTVLVQRGMLAFNGGGSSSADGFTVASGATLDFTGHTFSLGEGTVGGLGTVAVGGGELAVGGNVTVAGFSQSFSTVSGAGTLTVTGSAAFAAKMVQAGSGTTILRGASTIHDKFFDLDGGRILENQGALTLTHGVIHLGRNPFGASLGGGTIRNDAGATFDIEAATTVFNGKGAVAFENAGLFEQTVTAGVTRVEVDFTDTGAIVAHSGVLDFAKPITGDGTLAVDAGATLEVDGSAAASLGMSFNGAGATLALGKPAKFAATITGFAAGDTIDLLATQATRAKLKSGDRLAIFNGADKVATLQLAGDYAAASFAVASDGAGGTNITVTTPGPGHRLVAAMAGLGGAGGGALEATGLGHPGAWRPTLCAPGPAHFA